MIISVDTIPQLLEDLRRNKFYGQVMLQFRAGAITLLERRETFLTDEDRSYSTKGRPGNDHER